jgi:hypothetical protein
MNTHDRITLPEIEKAAMDELATLMRAQGCLEEGELIQRLDLTGN